MLATVKVDFSLYLSNSGGLMNLWILDGFQEIVMTIVHNYDHMMKGWCQQARSFKRQNEMQSVLYFHICLI